MTPAEQTTRTLRTCLWSALAVGAIGVALSAAGYVNEPSRFARAYLLAFVFWLQVPLGCLAIGLLHELVGGRWGDLLRPFISTAVVTMPLFVLLIVPVWMQTDVLFPWHEDGTDSIAHISAEKRLYLNETAFAWRSGGYLLAWCAGSVLVASWSRPLRGRTGVTDPGSRQRIAAIGVLLFILTVSFAGVDWLMSLEPAWYSSIYGGLVVVGATLAAWCFMAATAGWLSPHATQPDESAGQAFHDVGNLLLAFLLVWVYFAFSQFLIIWSGDFPEETVWYRNRLAGGWQWFVPVIIFGHFAIPFAMLLSRDVKRTPRRLAIVAAVLLLMRFIELYWSTMPAFSPSQFTPHWLDLAVPAAVGGVWVAMFAALLSRRLRHETEGALSHD